MGLMVHWDLKFRGTDQEVLEKLGTLRKIAERLPFEEIDGPAELDFDYFTRVSGKRYQGWKDWACIQGGFCNGKRIEKAFCLHLWPGEGCEPMNVGLRRLDNSLSWNWHSFCKTQYAKEFLKCHLLVIRLLDECKKVGILEGVCDEGDYWETRDPEKLGSAINTSTKMIQELFGKLKTLKTTGVKIESPIVNSQVHITEFEADHLKKTNSVLPPLEQN